MVRPPPDRAESGAPGPRIPQYVATALLGFVLTAAGGAFMVARNIDATVVEHAARLRAVEQRVAELCEALQCRTNTAHPLCVRLRLIEKTVTNQHPSSDNNFLD